MRIEMHMRSKGRTKAIRSWVKVINMPDAWIHVIDYCDDLPTCTVCGVVGPLYCGLGDRCENKLKMEGKEY